jgi:hypothetical protein
MAGMAMTVLNEDALPWTVGFEVETARAIWTRTGIPSALVRTNGEVTMNMDQQRALREGVPAARPALPHVRTTTNGGKAFVCASAGTTVNTNGSVLQRRHSKASGVQYQEVLSRILGRVQHRLA